MPSSRGSSQSRDWTHVFHIAGRFFTVCTTREAQEYWSGEPIPSLGDFSNPGIELGSPALQVDSLPAELPGKPRVHHVKCQAEWIISWNQDFQEKYQQSQICRWNHFSGRRWKGTKEPLDEGERGEWTSWLKTQYSKNQDHGIRSHHFMANRWGNNENSERLYFLGLQNHCRWWLQPWN